MNLEIRNNGFGIHTLLLGYMNLRYEEYNRLFNMIKDNIVCRENDYSYIRSNYFCSDCISGIFLELYKKNNHYYMTVFTNPKTLLENICCKYDILFQTDLNQVNTLVEKINVALKKISDNDNIYTFDNAILSRVDLCVNYEFNNEYIVKQYLKLADRSVRADKDNRRYFKDEDGLLDFERNSHSFDVQNSNFELTMYDKRYQLVQYGQEKNLNKEYGNILRIEVKLKRRMIYTHFSNIKSNIDKLKSILMNSSNIMINNIAPLFYPGDYYTIELGLKRICDTTYLSNTKNIMCELFLEKINIERAYNSARVEFNLSDKQISTLKQNFQKISLNPSKITQKDAKKGSAFLPGFVELLKITEKSFI